MPTFLGAHAVPAEFRDGPERQPDATDAYVASVIDEQLPAVARQGIARFCDVFCEQGVFSADQSRRILRAAAGHGLALRLHADELAPSGGAELAAELAAAASAELAAAPGPGSAVGRGCLSADHLGAPSEEGIAALARAAEAGTPVVATLLPATSWFLGKHHFAPARRFIDAGIPVALATDLNPGTSPTLSLPLVMSIACVEMGLTPAEALAAVTINAAHSLGLGAQIGSIEPGKQADLVVWDVPDSRADPVLARRPPRPNCRQAREPSSSSEADRTGSPVSAACLVGWPDGYAAGLDVPTQSSSVELGRFLRFSHTVNAVQDLVAPGPVVGRPEDPWRPRPTPFHAPLSAKRSWQRSDPRLPPHRLCTTPTVRAICRNRARPGRAARASPWRPRPAKAGRVSNAVQKPRPAGPAARETGGNRAGRPRPRADGRRFPPAPS